MDFRDEAPESVSQWMTTRQVSAFSGYSPKTFANWRWQGIGPPYTKISPGRGGRILYRRADVEELFAAGLVETR